MSVFALPIAISEQVAATLSRYADYTLLALVYQRARTYDISPFGKTDKAIPEHLPKQLTLIFDGRDTARPRNCTSGACRFIHASGPMTPNAASCPTNLSPAASTTPAV